MAKIIDPFDNREEPEPEDDNEQLLEEQLGDLRGMVENMMSSFGITPDDLMGAGVEPVTVALRLKTPLRMDQALVTALLTQAFDAEDVKYVGMKGTPEGTSVHLVEVEDGLYRVINFNPGAGELPPDLKEHFLLEDIGVEVPWFFVEPYDPFGEGEVQEQAEEEIGSPENEEEGLGGIQELFGQEDPFSAAERIMNALTAEVIERHAASMDQVYVPATGEWVECSDALVDVLRDGTAADFFLGNDDDDEGVDINDEKWMAAAQEARLSFPEFQEAFEKRSAKDKKTEYSVRAPFTEEDSMEGDITELLWVTVEAIEADEIRGKINSVPMSLMEYHPGEAVEVEVDDIVDWMISKGKTVKGGFTLNLLD